MSGYVANDTYEYYVNELRSFEVPGTQQAVVGATCIVVSHAGISKLQVQC